jgi:endoglucanase
MKDLKIGVNLGGWLSQYAEYSHHHFKTFITVDDIKRIADWGMTHVRLPIDYNILEDDDKPFIYKESGFSYIDGCLEWCKENGLNMVLDLHRAPGYSFDANFDSNILFDDILLQKRLIALWETLIRRYSGQKKPVIFFELLNEIVLPTSAPWNNLSQKIHEAIRKIDKDSWLIIGGNDWNSVGALKEIRRFDDPKIIYTFHFYEPLPFTHQKAYWVNELKLFDKELDYPGRIDGLDEFIKKYPECNKRLGRYVGINMDEYFLRTELQQAVDFMKDTGRHLYCGEFGVIDLAPKNGSLNWYKDYVKLLNEFDISYACWSYKQMDFGLVDKDGRINNEELIKIISRK